ncbi:hypothetical protein Tco_1031608 [Tanacetum coccineum]|uniref:Uncharacterized protein n=1 Tax=Tanacetum coccineum TaxID=301880 RepID=A0ABQ5GBR9_9ASTR
MASMNTRLNIKKLDGNIVQKHRGSKQVGFKQLGPGVETGVHRVHDEKRVWFEVELQGVQRDREAEVFQYISIRTFCLRLHLRMEERSSYTKIEEVRMKASRCEESCFKAIEGYAKEYQIRSMGLVVVVLT